nr:hypothetical protein [Candidatus Sigynarchaeota archaeon]
MKTSIHPVNLASSSELAAKRSGPPPSERVWGRGFPVRQGIQFFLALSERVMLLASGLIIAGYLLCLAPGAYIFGQFGNVRSQVAGRIWFEVLFNVIGYSFGATQVRHRHGNLLFAYLYWETEDLFRRTIVNPTSLTLQFAWWQMIVVVGWIAFYIAIARFIAITILRIRSGQKWKDRVRHEFRNMRRWQRGIVISLLVGTVLVSSAYTVLTSRYYSEPIQVQPKDYDIEVRTWAEIDPSWYMNSSYPERLDLAAQYDRWNMTLENLGGCLPDADGNYESYAPTLNMSEAQGLSDMLGWWKANYPNVRFRASAPGIGLGSAGVSDSSIYTPAAVKRFVDVCRLFPGNTSNVVGVYSDWEGPGADGPRDSNETRTGMSVARWIDTMAYAKSYFPNWTFVCCEDGDLIIDPFDGDPDMQYLAHKNIYNPIWDEYTPMLYRSTDFSTENPHFTKYTPAGAIFDYANLQLAAVDGNSSRCGAYVGCTGCGPYLNTSIPTTPRGAEDVPWTSIPTPFDIFARDVLILKHFQFKSFTIFICNEEVDPDSGRRWGFFQQYGQDALDRLMTIVNGPNGTIPFIIYEWGVIGDFRNVWEDSASNFDRLDHVWIMTIFCVGSLSLMLWDCWARLPSVARRIATKFRNLPGNYPVFESG